MAKAIYASDTKKKKNSPTEWAESTKDGVARGVRIYGDVRVSDEDTRDKRGFKNYAKEAGARTPALGVSAQNRTSIPGRNRSSFSQFSQFSSAKDFNDYARMRREMEEAEGVRSAADKLAAMYSADHNMKSREQELKDQLLYSMSGIGGSDRVAGLKAYKDISKQQAVEKEQNAQLLYSMSGIGGSDRVAGLQAYKDIREQQRRKELQEASEALMQNYGYKKIGNEAVFVTPFSPLPKKTAENTATRAKAPGLFDINPEEYLENMGAIDSWNNRVPEAADPDAKAFLDKYFGGRIPTDDEFNDKYDEIYNDPSIPDEDVRYFYWDGAELVGKEMGRQSREQEARVGYDAALEALGADAAQYAGKTDAEYLSRYAPKVYGREGQKADSLYPVLENGPLQVTQEQMESWYANPLSHTTPDEQYSLMRWGVMTPEERENYTAIAQNSGAGIAQEYLKALEPELNKRVSAEKSRDAAAFAQEHPFLASMAATIERMSGAASYGMMSLEELLTGRTPDEYDLRRLGTRTADSVVGAVGEKIQQDVEGIWGKALGFGYQTMMSLADMGANMLVYGPAGAVASSGAMGLSAAASAYNDAIDRGADHQTANAMAAVSGIAEMLFEKFSIESLIGIAKGNGLGKAVLNVMRQMGIEASEEMGTEIANLIGDTILMGDMSVLEQAGPAEMAKQIGLAGLGGALMGGVTGGIAQGVNSWMNRGNQQQTETAQQETPAEEPQTPAEDAQQPEPTPEEPKTPVPDVRDALIREYTPTAAQEAQGEAETAMDEQEEAKKEKPAEGASTGKNGEAFGEARSARVTDEEGNTSAVTVLGVKSVSDSGLITLEVENENGERDTINAADAEFDDDNTNELMAYAASGRMDAKAMRGYLDGYDENIATAEEYAEAYTSVYSRARGGVDFEQAALGNEQARQYLTRDAMIDAYAAGQNAYNQVHDTIEPAAVETVAQTEAENVQLSAKDTTVVKGGKISRRYSQNAYNALGSEGKKKVLAQMELLGALASRTGHTIALVDTITGKDGAKANALYDPKTREIRVALDATEGAYAYAAAHELTHALKNEHSGEWVGFRSFVQGALEQNGENWNELVAYQMDRFGYSREQAEEEVVCNTVPAILSDERNVQKLYKGNRRLFDRIVDWVKQMLGDIKKAGEQLSKRSGSWKQMDALSKDRKTLQEMYDRLMDVMEKGREGQEGSDNNVVKMSAKEKEHYDFSKPFSEQVEDLREGRFPKNDALVVSGTPEVLQKIGFSNLPLTINQEHLLHIERDTEHYLSKELIRQLPELLKDPVAVIESQSANDSSIVMILKAIINEKPYIAPVYISSQSQSNMALIDSNNISTTFRKGNAVSKLFSDAIQKENAGNPSVYYWKKTEARDLFDVAGVQFSGNSIQDGLVHSIFDAGSSVNRAYLEQTETRQFARWFRNSRIVNDDGSPKVMYRGGGEKINVFDRKKSKASNLYGRGFYFTDSEMHAKQYGEARSYYLRIENPMSAESGARNITQNQMRAFLEAVAENEDYGLENYGYSATVESVLKELNGKPDFDALQDINATAIGDFVAAIELFNEVNGTNYDGIITPTETVVFDSRQIKSATDNIGLFDPDNPDIRYSMRDTDENVQSALAAEESAIAQVKAHRINAMEADKLAGQMLKLANSDYDRQELASRISRTISYMETGEDVDMQQVDDEMTDIAADVMNHSRTLDLEHEERMKPIRDYLRTTKIRLTDKQRAEAANLSGSYGAFRKSLFGRARLVSVGGIALDTAWQELNAIDRGLFPGNVREGDMPVLLQAAIDEAKPVYHNGMGMNADESANWLAGKMMEAYFALPAVKAAAKDAKTFGDSIRELKKAMSQFEDVSWSEYQNALQSIKQAQTNEERTQKQQEAAALRKKYQQWRAKDTAERKERELKNRYRAKIERTTMTLSNWLLKPTDAKHVPAGLEDSIRRMLETLDFSGKDTKTAAMLSERLASLASALENAQEGEDETRTVFLERDQQMIDEIRRVAELIRGNTSYQQMEGRGIYDLNSMELKELSKWLDVIRHNVTEASKLRGSNLPYTSVEEAAQLSMMEMGRKKAWKDKKWITKTWMESFGPDMQDSFTFFERLGPTANQIFRGLREGFDKVTRLTRQAETHTKEILKDVNLRELTGRRAKKISFELASGEKLELTKAQIMELYVLEKREQARGHLYGDGIVLQGDDDRRAKQLKPTDVKRIISALSAEEKKVADGLQSFVSRECASWGNEASVKLVGYRKFGEQYYWPIRTDSNTRNTTKLDESYAADINAIRNQGMTKQTVEGAKNAIVIGDIFDTYTRHISNMAAYAGYALPLSDFTRWYNSRGVKTEIEQMMGRKGLNYINNFLMAVNGSGLREEQSGIAKAAGVLSRNAKIASVGANVRVVVQQPTSYARAAMYMSPKYLSMGLAMKAPDADLVNRYCGIAQWKRWGFYETNIGPNLRQMIVGDETAADKMRELAMKPAAAGDNWTLNHLWNACVAETKAEYGYKEGSEAFYTQVGKRLSEIIDRTQVVDSVFHRSQMMRSKNAMNQMMTNFMSEPTKTYNMLMSAISDYADNRKNKAARNRVVRGMVVYAATGIMTAAAAAIVDAFRDDDAEKEWLEKYLDAIGNNAIDNLNPLGLLPGVKDVLSLLQGYEPSRLDQQSIQRIIWAVDEVKKYAEGTSKQNLYGVTYKIMQAVSSLVGIPVSNLMRDGNAIAQTITGVTPTLTAEARGNQTISHLFNALMKGEKERGKKLREELRIKAGMTPKEIDTELAEKLMGDELIKTAWEAKTAKNYGDMNRAKNALTAKGFNSETVDKAITRYGSSVTPKTPKVKDPAEQLMVTLYSEEEVVSAARILAGVETGGSVTEADVRSMISERIAGSEAKNPDDSVKSGIQSALKKDYLAMEAKGDVAGMNKLGMVMKNLLGTEDEDMEQWVKDQHSANLRTAVDSYDSAAASKAVQAMRKDGKTDSQIKSSLQKYKQLYIDAMNRKDTIAANKIKRLLIGLGLKGKNGDPLYDEETFIEWMKK